MLVTYSSKTKCMTVHMTLVINPYSVAEKWTHSNCGYVKGKIFYFSHIIISLYNTVHKTNEFVNWSVDFWLSTMIE